MAQTKRNLKAYIKEQGLVQRRVETDMQRELNVLLAKQYKTYFNQIENKGKISKTAQLEGENQIEIVLTKYARLTYMVYKHLYMKYIKKNIQKDFGSDIDTYIAQYIKEHLGSKISYINDTTLDDVKKVFKKATEDEDISRTSIAKALNSEIKQISKSRAKIIATTETHNAMGTAQFKQANALQEELNEPVYKIWIASEDSRTRPDHVAAQAQGLIPLNKPFRVGNTYLMYPGDPNGPAEQVINCRCKMLEGTVDVLEDFL